MTLLGRILPLQMAGDEEAPPLSISFRWADAVPEQHPEPELDDAATEAGALGFVATFAGESIC
jgi:hypothetical protein